jgi:hypothetical protein
LPEVKKNGNTKKTLTKCLYCGKDFETRASVFLHGRGKYCSKECSNKAKIKKIEKICEVCGKVFDVIPFYADQKTCSKECRSRWISENQRGENHPNWKVKIRKFCEYCGKEFYVPPSVARKENCRFCSAHCRAKKTANIIKERSLLKRIKCICETCGNEFYVSPSMIRQGQGKHCSQKCRQVEKVKCICVECGKNFERRPSYFQDKQGSGKFCSHICKASWSAKNLIGEKAAHWQGGKTFKNRICLYCGNEFLTKHQDGKFCCREHQATWMHENIKGEKHPQFTSVKIKCKYCSEEIVVQPSQLKNKHGNFCSKECHHKWTSENLQGESSPYYNRKKLNCIICGKEFTITKHWEKLGRTKYCSQECYWKDLPNLIGGDKHPNWTGGPKDYCEKWNADFRKRIRAFFNYICINCGTRQKKKLLHCHHVYYDKKACCSLNENGVYVTNLGIKNNSYTFEIIGDPNKFVILCDSCHAKSSGKKNREYWARLFEGMINNYYFGKSYFTKEEFERIK